MLTGEKGYAWQLAASQGPALLSAVELRHLRTQMSGKMMHNLWVLDYNFTPGERVRVGAANAAWIERPANHVHLYAPGLPYWEDIGRDGNPLFVDCAYLFFADAGLLRLDRLLNSPVRYARFIDDQGVAGELLREIVRIAVSEGGAGYWQAHARFFDLLTLLHQASPIDDDFYRIRETRSAVEHSPFVRQVLAYFHAHIAAPVTIAGLANEIGMSSSTLAHRYRSEMGESPMVTLKRERINLAKVLLSKGYRLKEIAAQVGFSDEFHLSNTFKQVEGVSPKTYRQLASSQQQ